VTVSEQRRQAGGVALGILLFSALWLYLNWGAQGLVTRAPQRVSDVPRYGDELRGIEELNLPEPAEPTPVYSGGGYYLRWSPNRSRLALTMNDGDHYRTIHVWDARKRQLKSVVSIRDLDPGSGRDYRYVWSRNSKALLIYGGGELATDQPYGRFRVGKLCMVYVAGRDELSWISPCHGTKWGG
jgi:hypothetical protein